MLRDELRSIWSAISPFHLDWLQVEVSARCHGRCGYCPVGRSPGRSRGTLMSMEVFEHLEPFFHSTGLVFLQGWGEPLLHPRFWEMAGRARRAAARVGFTTSGVHLDEGNRRGLIQSGVDIMGVTLAGARQSTHDRFRGGCPLDVIDANLRRLRQEREETASHLPAIHIAYLLLAGNLEEVEAVVDLAERWGASEIVVSQLGLVLDASLEEESLLTRPGLWSRACEHLEAAGVRAAEKGIRLHPCGPPGTGPAAVCGENVLRSCFVSAAGDVSPCVMTNVPCDVATHRFRGREHPLDVVTFGNVREHSLPEIWHSEVAREFRAVFRNRISGRGGGALPGPCRRCYRLLETEAEA
jgi:MoaA/NifB/PqqE/SkfB family radical SAM enzyme